MQNAEAKCKTLCAVDRCYKRTTLTFDNGLFFLLQSYSVSMILSTVFMLHDRNCICSLCPHIPYTRFHEAINRLQQLENLSLFSSRLGSRTTVISWKNVPMWLSTAEVNSRCSSHLLGWWSHQCRKLGPETGMPTVHWLKYTPMPWRWHRNEWQPFYHMVSTPK